MDTLSSVTHRSPVATAAIWTVQIVVGLVFVAAGVAKLAGAPQMVEVFDQIGIGQWFRFVTGTVEIAGGALLVWPGRSSYGALLLTATMVGALFTHAVVIGGTWQPAAVLFALCLLLLWLNRRQLSVVR